MIQSHLSQNGHQEENKQCRLVVIKENESICSAEGNVAVTMEITSEAPHKLNTELPYDPNTPPFSIYLKNFANISQRNLHIYVCGSTDHNSQTMGSAKASTDR